MNSKKVQRLCQWPGSNQQRSHTAVSLLCVFVRSPAACRSAAGLAGIKYRGQAVALYRLALPRSAAALSILRPGLSNRVPCLIAADTINRELS